VGGGRSECAEGDDIGILQLALPRFVRDRERKSGLPSGKGGVAASGVVGIDQTWVPLFPFLGNHPIRLGGAAYSAVRGEI